MTTLNDLPPRMREIYTKISDYSRNRGVSVGQASKDLSLPPSQYYKARALLGKGNPRQKSEPIIEKRKYTKRAKMLTLEVPAQSTVQMTLVRGTPDQIAELLKGLS